MKKRFTDCDKWYKPWWRHLTPEEKIAWYYITERCDNVGVWDADFELAEFQIGKKINWDKLIKNTKGNIEVLESGKWWLVDFCLFQYGTLRPDCPPHKTYIQLLQKHGLIRRVGVVYSQGSDTLQEKETEEEKEVDMDKELEKAKATEYKRKAMEQAELRRTISRENKGREYRR